MEILRKVKCQDKLPNKKGEYFVEYLRQNKKEVLRFEIYEESKQYWKNFVECWYEPIEMELPDTIL